MTDSMSQISTWVRPGTLGRRRLGRMAGATVSALALTAVLAGCGSDADGPASVPTRVPATPAESPPGATPIGSVAMMSTSITGMAVNAADGTLIVQSTAPDRLTVYALGPAESMESSDAEVLAVDLPENTGPLALTADGTALVPSPSGLMAISLDDGSTRTAEVDGSALSAAQIGDGRLAVGTDKGSVVLFDADLAPERTVTGFVSVDGLAAAGDQLLALDAHQTSVTEVNVDDGALSGALRAGVGSTGIIADHYGRVIAADTDGGQILVFSTDPLLNRQMGPVGKSPYGLADDADRNLVWVTLTGANEVAAFDLSSGAPVEEYRFPTVQDPRSVAVDEQTGDLYIGSGSGGGIQRISASEIQ